MRWSKRWHSLDEEISRWATRERANQWSREGNYCVLNERGRAVIRELCEAGHKSIADEIGHGDSIVARDISIFGAPIPRTGDWPWHEDWRHGHSWPSQYFRHYDHHAPRSVPYDVKFPWELSRLSFLPALVHADVLDASTHRTAFAFLTLEDWTRRNPLAYSVNWYPMEAAVRGLSICLFADMTRQSALTDPQAIDLMRALARHGEFIEHTLELTDNAGNHYAAELVALFLIGRTLTGYYPAAERWCAFAAGEIEREICLQILPDGVNFEKSTAYHGLVLELFLLAALSMERHRRSLSDRSLRRLKRAAAYSDWFQRPDDVIPLVGDTDDARIIDLDDYSVRDRRYLVDIAAVLFDDEQLAGSSREVSNASLWLFGADAVRHQGGASRNRPPRSGYRHFEDGGVVVAKNEQNYLFMDVGEVGQNGLGGHGHNDLLSFELFMRGQALIVDPGTYLYSGDFTTHGLLRGTHSHNGLRIDGSEIASMTGNFRISNEAQPLAVACQPAGDTTLAIEAGHNGYADLDDPVIHRRRMLFDWEKGSLQCLDTLECAGTHMTERFLHFAPGLEPVLASNELSLRGTSAQFTVRWDPKSDAALEKDFVCPGFGRKQESMTLVVKRAIEGSETLTLDIFADDGSSDVGGVSSS